MGYRSTPRTQTVMRALQTVFFGRKLISKIGAILVLLGVVWGGYQHQLSAQSSAEEITGQVVGVADGDTLTVLDATQTQHRIRLAFIDAPEKVQPYGQVAKKALSDWVFDQSVRVQVIDTDRYGRTVGVVWLNEEEINYKQVEAGLAWHYVTYAKKSQSEADFDRYASAQAAAQAQHIGLWQDPEPTPPWNYRRLKRAVAQ